MIKMLLRDSLYECPKAWQNMVIHANPHGSEPQAIENIQKELLKFGVNYDPYEEEDEDGNIVVEFPSEESYSLFLLRWL